MNCKEIVKKYLKDNGYDGLYVPGECGCEIDDLQPCSEDMSECKPGYKKIEKDGFSIGPEKA
jgi:hypothetical protein